MKQNKANFVSVYLNSHNKQQTLEHFPMRHGDVSVKDLM